ncbi:MAG TPA: rhodanese-like domain-containing protein [Beijerinckiaceae bacterium]|nr:rhodanese-like domain-containing protein [Beijerinckiaceae bacterium]
MLARRTVLALPVAAFAAPASAQGALPSVTVSEAQERLASGKSVLVDIRRPEEWAETGVASGAVRLDMTADDFLPKLQSLQKANPGKDIDIICRTANRTAFVQSELAKRGWKGIVNVRGGMAGRAPDIGWIAAKLPIVK